MYRSLARHLATVLTLLALVLPGAGHASAYDDHDRTPSAIAMTGDALLIRPILLATTVVGTGVFLVSLPFSALGGNVGEAGKVLVLGPAEATFVRCLGCARPGRKEPTVTSAD